ncbi:MAG: nuclear transport factor 2 family protein [Nevskiales bacterium]
MLSIEQISDRLELQQLVTDYVNALDARAFDRLDRVFTPDAHIDYTAMGGIAGPYPKIKAWLPEALKHFPAYMHFIGNLSFEIRGDTATGQIACFNPMVIPKVAGDTGPERSEAGAGAGESVASRTHSRSARNTVSATDGGTDTMFLGLWYHDRYVRTPQGWRIAERSESKCYDFNMPDWMKKALKMV